jgi:hypothetical protein
MSALDPALEPATPRISARCRPSPSSAASIKARPMAKSECAFTHTRNTAQAAAVRARLGGDSSAITSSYSASTAAMLTRSGRN